jgi:hypothetical protein
MVEYNCINCGKKFKQKCHFINHTEKKKKICVQKSVDPEITYNRPKLVNSDPKEPINNPELVENNIDKKNICMYCHQIFSNKSHLTRHVKKNCKVKKLQDEEKENIFKQLIDKEEKFNLLMKNFEILQQQNKDITQKNEELQKQVKDIISKNITKNKKIINNNQTNNINIYPVKLVKFGEEDLNKIDIKYYLEPAIKEIGKQSFIKLTENIHFNPQYPQYQNVYLSDYNREKFMVYNGNDWILKNNGNIIIFDIKEKILKFCNIKREEIEKIKDGCKILKKIDAVFTRYYNLVSGEIDEDDEYLKKRSDEFQTLIEKELKQLLYNNKEIVIENYSNNIITSSNIIENK